MKRIYHAPKDYTKKEIANILEHQNTDELTSLGISVGINYPDWKYAQDVCIKLCEHNNALVRANAILGLAHIARTKKKLEKYLVKPILLRELKENEEFRNNIIYYIEDINLFMKWSIGKKSLMKYDNK